MSNPGHNSVRMHTQSCVGTERRAHGSSYSASLARQQAPDHWGLCLKRKVECNGKKTQHWHPIFIFMWTHTLSPQTHTHEQEEMEIKGGRNDIHCRCLCRFFFQPCVEKELVWFWEQRASSHTNVIPGTCRWLRWREELGEEWEQGLCSSYTPIWVPSDFTVLFTFLHICQVGARIILTLLLNMKTLRTVLRKCLAQCYSLSSDSKNVFSTPGLHFF